MHKLKLIFLSILESTGNKDSRTIDMHSFDNVPSTIPERKDDVANEKHLN